MNKNSGGTVTYYPAAGAMRVGSTLYYVVSTRSTRRLKDQLGSASVVTDSTPSALAGTLLAHSQSVPQIQREKLSRRIPNLHRYLGEAGGGGDTNSVQRIKAPEGPGTVRGSQRPYWEGRSKSDF
ncbi:MAG TPA: hypothetical protein VK249_25145 [Anaerolineales bacterium]|nr:hypothetical protein [Anaerolineales bacterium]